LTLSVLSPAIENAWSGLPKYEEKPPKLEVLARRFANSTFAKTAVASFKSIPDVFFLGLEHRKRGKELSQKLILGHRLGQLSTHDIADIVIAQSQNSARFQQYVGGLLKKAGVIDKVTDVYRTSDSKRFLGFVDVYGVEEGAGFWQNVGNVFADKRNRTRKEVTQGLIYYSCLAGGLIGLPLYLAKKVLATGAIAQAAEKIGDKTKSEFVKKAAERVGSMAAFSLIFGAASTVEEIMEYYAGKTKSKKLGKALTCTANLIDAAISLFLAKGAAETSLNPETYQKMIEQSKGYYWSSKISDVKGKFNDIKDTAKAAALVLAQEDSLEHLLKIMQNTNFEFDTSSLDSMRVQLYAYLHFLEDPDAMRILEEKGIDLYDYCHNVLDMENIQLEDLDYLAKAADNDGLNILKAAHEKLGLEYMSPIEIAYIGFFQDIGGTAEVVDQIAEMGVEKIDSIQDLRNLSNFFGFTEPKYGSEFTFQDIEDKEGCIELINRCGVTDFGRYTPEIIDELIKGLDPEYKSDLPSALVVVTNHGTVFSNLEDPEGIMELMRGHKVHVYEIRDDQGYFNAIREVGAQKPIIYREPRGHGDPDNIEFGWARPSEGEDKVDRSQLDVSDLDELIALRQYVANYGKSINCSCSTGGDNNGRDNVVDIDAKAFPTVTAIGSRVPISGMQLVLDDDNMVRDVHFVEANTLEKDPRGFMPEAKYCARVFDN